MAEFTFTRTEEKTVSYEVKIQAPDIEEAIEAFGMMMRTGEFWDECEIVYEGVSESWEEVEYVDPVSGSTVTESIQD